MPNTFADIYTSLLKNEIFLEKARENLTQGADALTCALEYADNGKPDFTLAYLLLTELSDAEKREILAVSFDQHAKHAEEKAEQFDEKFHRPFPLIKLEAQKDRLAAQQIRQGRRVGRESMPIKIVNMN